MTNCGLCRHFSNTFNEFREWHCNLHGIKVSITFPHDQLCEDFSSKYTCESCKWYDGPRTQVCNYYELEDKAWVFSPMEISSDFGCNKWESEDD